MSSGSALEESPGERSVRVLISHLNSLIFALSKLISATQGDLGGLRRDEMRKAVERLISRLSAFKPTGPTNAGDAALAEAITGFAKSYVGRIDELTSKLEALAADISKPTTAESAVAYLKSLFELAWGKATEEVVKSMLRPG